MLLSDDQINKDVDRVPQGLAFSLRVLRVENFHRVFLPRQSGLCNLMDDFRGVGHAILLESNVLQSFPAEHSKSIVGIGQPQPGKRSSEKDSQLEHDLLLQSRLRFLVEKP